jgi:hypothetical protein
MAKRRPRESDDTDDDMGDNCCSMKVLTILILLTMVVQLAVMMTPLVAGYTVYVNNKESFDAVGNLSTRDIINNLNNVKDLPIQSLGKDSKHALHNAKIATDSVLNLLARVKNITGEVDSNADIFKDIREVLRKTMVPLDSIKDLLNPHMRGTMLKILDQVMRILDTMSDAEIHQLIMAIDKASIAANRALSIGNVNKTLHVMDDADRTLNKFDLMLSKFVN